MDFLSEGIPARDPDEEEDIFVVIALNKKEHYAQGLRLFRTIKEAEQFIRDYSQLPRTEQLEFSYNLVGYEDD